MQQIETKTNLLDLLLDSINELKSLLRKNKANELSDEYNLINYEKIKKFTKFQTNLFYI